MSARVYTGLNPSNFIRKRFLQICVVVHCNRCLTPEYSKTTAHFNDNVDTDNQMYVP
jgi:hypothetical protein